ncbi:MAG: bifunctional tetrahydrofolate synthase/dihydrofolate synthase [Gammaproteobacteria bacterium]|jgi:dihydrofolate synthase/folylpolyglutamate synthase
MKDLQAWLDYIEALHAREIDLGLDRVRAVARHLMPDRPSARVITVAGTNGKGSCVATLEGLLLAQGLKVGVYTSPHLQRYNERIRICGQEVSDSSLCEAFSLIEAARGDISLTYFEFGTLAALLLFQQAELDVLVLEVGLGGRLDAVNIVDCDVAVITSIDLDHTDWLGETREEIGREKAGILRSGKPLVCADRQPPASVLEVAGAVSSPVYLAGREFDQRISDTGAWSWQGSNQRDCQLNLDTLRVPALHPDVVAAAMQALLLLGLLPEAAVVDRVLAELRLAGRYEQFRDASGSCEVVLDVAHNPAAAKLLKNRLAAAKANSPVARQVLLVLAIMADKDVEGFVQALDSVVDIWYIAQVNQPRCLAAQKLAERMEPIISSQPVTVCQDVVSAYQQACEHAGPDDLVVVTGSFLTVAAIRAFLKR